MTTLKQDVPPLSRHVHIHDLRSLLQILCRRTPVQKT